jgi:hypothetical protein
MGRLRSSPIYGLREFPTGGYPERTAVNAEAGDATLWLGATSSTGYASTLKACRARGRHAMSE